MRHLLAVACCGLFALACCGLFAVTAFGQGAATTRSLTTVREEPKKPVEAREIDLAEAKVEFNKDAKLNDPLKLTSAGDLKLSPLSALGSNVKADFKTEYVLFFQWQGSGKDKLTSAVVTKDGKTTVTFTLKPGATEDLRQHSRAFILPAGAEWKVAK
jgi:hypothetical protein